MSDLREQVAKIAAGDTVTARFTHGLDEYTVSGVARDDEGWLRVGGTVLRRNDTPVEYLLAIESHEPAKPPVPPEPTGDVVVQTDVGLHYGPAPEVCNWLEFESQTFMPWAEIADGDVKVYRPEPSPERIEELVRDYDIELSEDATDIPRTLRAFVADLFGGES